MDKLLTGRRVLVVEDEMMILMMIEGMLEDLGASVTPAATIDQALGLIDARVFDVAMLDLNLDGQRTYPVADKLAARGVPFLFSTGYSDHGLKEGYGDRPVLKKPFQHDELAEILKHLLVVAPDRRR